MSRFAIDMVYLLCSLQWLELLGRETERAPYRDPVLHIHAPRLVALRGGGRNEETPTTKNKREMPRGFLLLEQSFQPTLSPLCGLASWPLLGTCSVFPGEYAMS